MSQNDAAVIGGGAAGVLGGTTGAVRYAQIVRQWTHDLTYFTAPGTLRTAERTELAARGIGVVDTVIEQLVIDADRLRGVQLDDGCVVQLDALFVPPRFVPNNRRSPSPALTNHRSVPEGATMTHPTPNARTSVAGPGS